MILRECGTKPSREEEATLDPRKSLLPREDDPEPIFPDEPRAEDLTVLAVDREWISRLRAAARDLARGESVSDGAVLEGS